MVDDSVTKNIAYFIFAISFFVMIYFISQQARKNRLSAIDQHAPKVAGHDILDGGAKIVMVSGDALKIKSNTASSADVWVSVVDTISE